MRYLIIVLLFVSKLSFGLTKAPNILRVCLDNNTSIATVTWQQPMDLCGSFSVLYVYSNENNTGWKLEKRIPTISQTNCDIVLADLTSSWRFRITAYFACNGIDSFYSNEMGIDQSKPAPQELDSVSFDRVSQKLCAGWHKNDSTDTKGYRIYEQYSNGVNNTLIDVNNTVSLLNSHDHTVAASIAIAAFDSCNLFTAITNPQRAAYLTGSIDSCKKKISLSWFRYQGWASIEQSLYLSTNRGGFVKSAPLVTTQTTIDINNIIMGDSLCYFVQTKNLITSNTSSSNIICFQTRKLKTPKVNYLSNVTVENDAYVLITFIEDINADTDSLLIEKSENNGPFGRFSKIKANKISSKYVLKDINADFNNALYSYRLSTEDKCGNFTSVSNEGRTIFLAKPTYSKNEYTIRWDPYSNWEKGILQQNIEYSPDRSTWNNLQTEPAGITFFNTTTKFFDSDSICLRIANVESLNSFGFSSISLSNIRCLYNIKEFYFPTTLNPTSNNNTFKIYGTGYDKSRGGMEIFNRWGELVFQTSNIESGWDATIKGEKAEQGNYIYKVSFYDQLNNFHIKSGTILIIQ